MQIYTDTRGKELPGNYNHVLLSELFHIQSSKWPGVASEHLATLYNEVTRFVEAGLRHIAKDDRVQVELLEMTSASLERRRLTAEEELKRLFEDEKQHPITYNHYYTDNVQNARQNSTRESIKKAMNDVMAHDWNGKLHISNNTVDAEKLLASLQKRIIVDMDEQACTEALEGLFAYYKV